MHYQPTRLFSQDIFSEEDLGCLHEIAAASPWSDLIASQRWREESAIDFVFTSAQIEGNTYTRADTISLLKIGVTANDKRYSDAVMIMNLRAAYDYILDHAHLVLSDPAAELSRYHSILMRGLLPDEDLGAARKTRGTMIGGSAYQPLSGADHLLRERSTLFAEMDKISDPFAKAIYASTNLAYLQFFEDGNKRTSRIFQNAVLIAHNLAPVLFPVTAIKDYLDGVLTYYDHGDPILNRAFMLQAYKTTYGDCGAAADKSQAFDSPA
jgi:Fic family protein